MSIASEISRLQGAKADIKTAIEGKGVTVPSATKLDGYADLVDAIPQGSTPTGTKQISVTQNGTQTENVSGYASAQLNVSVPNSYSAGDEGKVVDSGALVAQTAHADVTPTTSDQTIDTTTNNSLKVKGDADLVASNIKKDVEIFGVTGSYEGSGGGGGATIIDTIQATAVRATKIDIDPTWFNTYSLILVVPDVEFSATDWLYIAVDSTSGGLYAIQQMTGAGAECSVVLAKKKGDNTKYAGAWINGTPVVSTYNVDISYLYWYMYTSSRTMTGTFTIMGVA